MIWLNSSTLLEHKITHLPSSEKQKQPSTCLQTMIDQKRRWLVSTKSHPPGHPSSMTRKPGTRRQLSQKSTRCRAKINKIRPQLMFIRIPVSLVLTLPSRKPSPTSRRVLRQDQSWLEPHLCQVWKYSPKSTFQNPSIQWWSQPHSIAPVVRTSTVCRLVKLNHQSCEWKKSRARQYIYNVPPMVPTALCIGSAAITTCNHHA